MTEQTLEQEKLRAVRSAVIEYFEARLRKQHSLSDLFPSRDMIYHSSELASARTQLGREYQDYFDVTIERLLEEGAIQRKGSQNNFSYAGDFEIIAENHRQAIAAGDR